jgi:hypothetical protein
MAGMTGPFAAHPGGHAAPARLSIFRRLLRTTRRKAAVPAAATAGAATPAVAPFDCCKHCQGMCAHPDNHPVPCSDGCNAPVLGDRMLNDVRREWSGQLAHADAMHALNARYLPPARYVNGRNLGTQPRRQPVYGERPQADVLAAERQMRDEYFAPGGAEIIYSRADHDEIDREFTDRPSPALLRKVIAGLRKL